MSLAIKSKSSTSVFGNWRMWVVKVNVGTQPNGPYLFVTTGGRMSEKKEIANWSGIPPGRDI